MASALCRLPLRPALRRLAGKSPASKLWQSNKMGVWEQEFRSQLKKSTSFDLLIAQVRAGKYLNQNASGSSDKASTAIARAHVQAVQNNMLPYLMQMSDCAQDAPNSVCVAAYDEVLRLLKKGNGVVQPYQLRNIIKAMKNISNLRAQHRAQQASESSPQQLAAAQKATEPSSVGNPSLESAAVPSRQERTRSKRATTTATKTASSSPISPISTVEQPEQRSLVWREGRFVPVEDTVATTVTTPEPSNGQVSAFTPTPAAISEPANETLDVSTPTSESSNGQGLCFHFHPRIF
ncbi:uncharacterized protein J3D65DRAFT_94731 [Phyllosticta citribraziliensis]|uniref:Uncharacterized protein n=1 Tax=Phyllosticta citribraziliensis TaxID=989973 RepID=A0ABR1LA68_9PEZI